MDDLKTIAVSRLMLDNFPHIKAKGNANACAGADCAEVWRRRSRWHLIEERIILGARTPPPGLDLKSKNSFETPVAYWSSRHTL